MRLIILISLVLSLQACASLLREHTACNQNHADTNIQSLMNAACSGDRYAQYQLGVAFDEGDGVETDPALAATYYRLAAAVNTGKSYIYVPGAGKVPGYVTPIDNGQAHPGDARAKYRLALLYKEGRGVRQDAVKAEKYFAAAASQGVTNLE